jgi:NADPH-ferrihemoprotein reductase
LESINSEKLVVLFYGSQTGTAEDFAIRLQNEISSKLNLPTVVLDPEEYDMQELKEWQHFDESRDWVCGFFMAS